MPLLTTNAGSGSFGGSGPPGDNDFMWGTGPTDFFLWDDGPTDFMTWQ